MDQRSIRLAYSLSCLLGHSYVGTEHLLLALTLQPGSTARLLDSQLLSTGELLGQLLAQKGLGCGNTPLLYGFTGHAQAVLRRCAESRCSLTEALLRQEDCGAYALLLRCGADPAALFTLLCLGEEARKEQSKENMRLLDQFTVDLVERAQTADPIIGRDREIRAVLQILSRRQKNNPALIGEPGVGKTAIVEGVAMALATGQVPAPLRGKRLLSLDMSGVLAGTKYRGEFEERIRDILAEVRRVRNVILFVDEMHTLVGAGAAEGAIDAANLLKPALGRGELQLIGATTLTEYRKFIEKDAALERRFRTVQIAPASREETLRILEGLRPFLEQHHGLAITREAMEAAVEYSCRYLTDKFLPDKAVDLLDEGAACCQMAGDALPGDEAGLALQDQLRQAVREGAYERAASLRDRLLKKKEAPPTQVLAADIAAAVSNRTGIPIGSLSHGQRDRLLKLEDTLKEKIVGQDEAIAAVCRAVHRGRSGLAEESRPVAALMLTGPTGVGKTELCKCLAEAVYGSREELIRLDMSEYMEKHAVSRLLGAPPGYIGHGEGGELTEKVRRKPYSLVLLDEVEKAHRDICGILLQILEDGVLTDACGKKVDFRNTLLVMTSNLGSSGEMKGGLGFGQSRERQLSRLLQNHFSPELMGRIDCIAGFSPLGEEALEQIACLRLNELMQRCQKLGLKLEETGELGQYFAKKAAKRPSGARALRSLIREELEAPIAAQLLQEQPPTAVNAQICEGRLCLSYG